LCHLQMRYAKRAKHVDVLDLKAGVWRELQRSASERVDPATNAAAPVSFQDVVSGLRSGDGGDVSDLSVHLCFICLLHLANEESLVVQSPEMGKLLVWPEARGNVDAAG
jgi:condensin complex subunit 2